jgi:hypothetical protein
LHINVYQVLTALYANMQSVLKSRSRVVLAVLFVFIFGVLLVGLLETTLSLVQTSRTVPSAGVVKGIGVGIYWDYGCTNKASSINWGVLEPGSSRTVTVYVRNEGNTVTTLSETTQNWNPLAASNYLTLSWDYAGRTVSVNQVLRINLTLTVSSTVSEITSFSFDVMITATG